MRESFALYDYKKFKEIGFYDEDFFLYEEGPSSGVMFQRKGYKEAILDNGEYSYHMQTSPMVTRFKFQCMKKSRIHFLEKYRHTGKFKIFLLKLIWVNVFIK